MRFLCAAVVSLLFLLSGCSLLSEQDGAAVDTAPEGDLAFSEGAFGDGAFGNPDPPVTIAPEFRDRGGVLRVGVAATTWDDPALIDEAREGEQQVADLLFDGLTSVSGSGLLEPAIASGWSVSPDAKTWTFEIRPDASFSNGGPITAADVKYSLDRVAELGIESLAANRLRDVDAIETVDATVVITLRRPFAELPRLLASPIFGVVPMGSGDQAGMPTTSGSLMVQSANDDVIELVPVDNDGSYVDAIELRLFDDEIAVADAFAAGELDIASTSGLGESVLAVADEGEDDKGSTDDSTDGSSADDDSAGGDTPGAERRVLPGVDTSFFVMNLGNEAFADPLIRQALVLAVDNTFVASGVGDDAAPLEGLLPRSSSAWRPAVCEDCPYQPDRAREILGGYAADALPLIHIDHLDDPQSEAMAAAIVGDLAYVGLDVRARPHSPQAFAAKAAVGELSLFQFGVVGSWSSPEAYLGSMFATDGADNVTSFSDAEVDRLLAEAAQTVDDAERTLLYQQAETRILQFSVAIPLFERQHVLLIDPKVQNVQSSALGWFDPSVVWIAAS